MSTIYELEGLATPGPFTASYSSAAKAREEDPGTDGGGSTGFVRRGPPQRWGAPVLAFMAINRDPKRDEQCEADTALLAHCRNNFMKALEALKDQHEAYTELMDTTDSGNHCSSLCSTCKLIKELETVHINK